MEEFIIPFLRDDLLKQSSSNQYYVSKIAKVGSLASHISECEREFRDRGHVFIYRMFDCIYSVIHHWNGIDQSLREKTWELLLKSSQKSSPSIVEKLNSNLSRDDQTMCRNSIKMNIYLLCQIIELFINEFSQANMVLDKGKGKKKKGPSTLMDQMEEIEIGLNAMNQLFQLQICKLWEPPVVEEDFVNLVTNICYKLLENADFCKNVAIKESISKILIQMITRYNHNMSCSVKLVQLLQSNSHFATHLLYICRAFIATDIMSDIIRDILTEICAYSSIDLERDSQTSSSFSSFLTDFAREFPIHVIPILSSLKTKLGEDPFTMRNCVLVVMGEVAIQVYSDGIDNATKRDAIVDVIEDHVADINGFVRAKALEILLSVIEKTNLPLPRIVKILSLLVGETGAIFDTTANVRRNAIRIISCVVDLNLSKGLSYADLKKNKDEETQKLLELEQQLAEMPAAEIVDAQNQLDYLKEQTLNGNKRSSISAPLESQSVARENLERKILEMKSIIFIVERLMEITLLIESSIANIQTMLSSRVASDVQEAIQFFVNAKRSNVVNVDVGIRKMLPQVCSKDDKIKTAITQAYKTLYLTVEDGESNHNEMIIDSLSNLVINPTYGELQCLEKLIINFTESGDLDQKIIHCLWNRLRSGKTDLEKKCAMIIFSMVANVSKPFMSKYFNMMLTEVVPTSDYESLDLQLIDYVCVSIQKMTKARVVGKLSEVFRLPKTHNLFERLSNLLINTFTLRHKDNWIPMAISIVDTIYLMAENPDWLCTNIISSLANKAYIPDVQTETDVGPKTLIHRFQLTRFVAIGSHMAMKQFIHFDVSILTELKRRNTIKEQMDQEKKTKKLTQRQRRQTQNGDLEEEMGLTGATADDIEAEFIKKIIETELVTDPTKLAPFMLNLAVHIVTNVSKFKDKDLQKVVSLSLGKMLLTSSTLAMKHIDLLFNLAARSPSEVIRANLIVPIGDLIKRFTTKLEPYTPHLYGRLRDQSPIVRLNVLNVLSHLILNDMIKVKGQISEITTCIVDDNARIVHLAKIFFQELATKEKALYNVMPDIISRLSNSETGVNETQFRTIMEYLMPFITKKNQSENLFGKICDRFHLTNDERSWRDLSFCLSLVPINDAIVRILQLNLGRFASKMHVDEVYTAINDIVNNAKKNIKGDLTAVIEEMSAQVAKYRTEGVEDEEANVSAMRAQAKKKSKSKKTRDSTASMKTPKPSTSQATTAVEGDDELVSATPARKRPVQKTTRKTRKDSDDDVSVDNEDCQSIAASRTRRTTQQISRAPVVDVFSDTESDEDDRSSGNENDDVVDKKRSTVLKRKLIMTSDSDQSE